MRRQIAIAAPRPTTRRLPQLLLAALGGVLTLVVAAGCGGGQNQQNPNADSAAVPGGAAAPVGANEAGKDSSYVAAQRQLDSAQAAGATVNQGLDSAAARGAAAANNDAVAQDTNAAMRNRRANP